MKSEFQLFYDASLEEKITDKMQIYDNDNQRSYIIGNKSPVALADASVEDAHCEILLLNGKYFIHNLSSFGMYYKLSPNEPTKMPYNNFFIVGKTWVHVSRTNAQCQIDLIDENYNKIKTAIMDINKEFTIGRSPLDDVIVENDKSVSKKHVKIIANNADVSITDYKDGNGATNGTWVNIVFAEIKAGKAAIRIGVTTFICISSHCIIIGFEESIELRELIASEHAKMQAIDNHAVYEIMHTRVEINQLEQRILTPPLENSIPPEEERKLSNYDINFSNRMKNEVYGAAKKDDTFKDAVRLQELYDQLHEMGPIQLITKGGFSKDEAQIAYFATKNAPLALECLSTYHTLTEQDINSLREISHTFENDDTYDQTIIRIVYSACHKNVHQTELFLRGNEFYEFIKKLKAERL